MANIHFISGLPRSGSTLLAALLSQNPRFHAGITSPVGYIFNAMLMAVSQRNESAMFIHDNNRKRLLRGVFDSYYGDVGHSVIFDTNRAWTGKLAALAELFPDCKVFCCVRNPAWIMDSIERLIRRNAFELSGIFGYEPSNTVYTRVGRLATSDGMVGFAIVRPTASAGAGSGSTSRSAEAAEARSCEGAGLRWRGKLCPGHE